MSSKFTLKALAEIAENPPSALGALTFHQHERVAAAAASDAAPRPIPSSFPSVPHGLASLPLALLWCTLLAIAVSGAWATPADDLARWDAFLAAQPAGAKTVALGDQIVTIEMARTWRDRMAARASGDKTTEFSSRSDNVTLWPGGNVFYAFDASVSANHQIAFTDALHEWETAANVHFILRTNQVNYVMVNDGGTTLSGGNSFVGMKGGAQALNIGTNSWVRPTLLHEIGHALGAIHEHQRSDRDTYVTIATAFLNDGNFVIVPTSTNETAYDFLSVMHYDRNAFGTDTIVPKPAYTAFSALMGVQFNPYLSRKDRQGMIALYGMPPTPTLVVTTTNDSGVGSLRAAIQTARDLVSDTPTLHSTVTFQLPSSGAGLQFANGVYTIKLTAELQPGPNTLVDATTQTVFGGNTNPAGPEVLLTPAFSSPEIAGIGVQMIAAGSEVRGFTINSFNFYGVEIIGANASSNVVAGCYVGLDPTGAVAAPNTFGGVYVHGQAHDNLIGGTAAASRNVISGNTYDGVVVIDSGTTGNVIQGNLIGLNALGTAAVPNVQSGVIVYNGAQNTVIGGTAAGARNVISGNQQYGILLLDAGTNGTAVLGNYIGLDVTGASAIANGTQSYFSGIGLFNGPQNTTIGGTAAGARNVISGNTAYGVAISDVATKNNSVLGNYIGLNAAGTAEVANGFAGIQLYGGSTGNVVGGSVAGAANVVSGNGSYGVAISDAGTGGNTVAGNIVGLNPAGTAALPNASFGVIVYSGANGNTIGGLAPGAGNVISGNQSDGVSIQSANDNAILGNLIGLDITGKVALGNSFGGIYIVGTASNNTIGAASGGRNYIAGNTGDGIALQADGNLVLGNTIGLNVAGTAVANTGSGISINGRNNTIGGSAPGSANLVSGNNNNGVFIYEDANPTVHSTGNALSGNSIFGNGFPAMSLGNGTTNDAGDADVGPNNQQNFPVLSGAVLALGTTVSGTLNSSASGTFRLEFFAAPALGPFGRADARTYLGSTSVLTDGSGTVAFSVPLGATVAPGQRITANATDSAGNTSEFAGAVTVTTTDTDNDGLPNAYESANGLTNGVNDAALDPDGDGLTNLQEFYAGTDPHNGASWPRISQVDVVGTDLRLTIPTAAGRNYRVEYTDNLGDSTAWRVLADQILGTAGNLQITDPGALARSSRFYRLRLQP